VSRAEVVLIALFTSALAAAGTVYVIERSNFLRTPPLAEPVMPDLRGLSEVEARGVAGAAHIALFVTSREPSSDAHSGAILRQSVLSGQHVPTDSTVNVVLAEEIAKVPNVLAAPLADAVKRLEERGYSVQVGTAIADEKAPVDTIVRQLPKADTAYAPPGIVVVQPSAGPAQVELPKLLGMGITAAKTQVEGLGLKAVVHWVEMAETQANVVLSQNPAAGQKVKPGSEVQLTVCSE
jgi:eukaryotic-like serine/threonine-protein kinase